jgi:hypothetical protein
VRYPTKCEACLSRSSSVIAGLAVIEAKAINDPTRTMSDEKEPDKVAPKKIFEIQFPNGGPAQYKRRLFADLEVVSAYGD